MKKLYWALILFIIVSFVPVRGNAETKNNNDQVAVALVIDHSGSMNNTDPLNDRFTAARMVLELMSDSDYLSIITFGDQAINLLPMIELGQGVQQAKTNLQTIPETLGYTDYMKALDLAKQNLDQISDEQASKFIIFLTDGEPRIRDAAVDMTLYMNELNGKIQTLATDGIPVYTVGFGESNQRVLNDISRMTRGVSFQGDGKTLANNFFEVLRELKNRYTLLNQSVSPGNSAFEFQVDKYTSRVTVLVTDDSGAGEIAMIAPSGSLVSPVLQQGNLWVFHLNEHPGPETHVYTLRGNWRGSIRAVRDTKTKLWINEPVNNSQIPYESEILAKVSQTGVVGDSVVLTAILKQSGKQLQHPLFITPLEQGYEIKMGKLPQTGNYELEVSLINGMQLVARTTSNFQVKNIPVLNTNLTSNNEPWIEGEERLIKATLVRGGIPIKNLEGVELIFDLLQGQEKSSLILQDNGKSESGDLIARDGSYSAILTTPPAGDFQYIITAKGEYLSELFFLIEEEVPITIETPGIISIKLPPDAVIGENHIAHVNVEISNQGKYPEQIRILQGDELLLQGLNVNPGETIQEQISITVPEGQKEAIFKFSGRYQATRFTQDRDQIALSIAEVEPSLFTIQNLLKAGGLILALLITLVLFRKLSQKRKQARLRGKLWYGKNPAQLENFIILSGTEPMKFSIGKDHMSNHHLDSDVEMGFDFNIRPIYSERGSSVTEFRCTPPGVLYQNGQIMTSAILSPGDEFEMGGLFFKYDMDQVSRHGQNVLEGRL